MKNKIVRRLIGFSPFLLFGLIIGYLIIADNYPLVIQHFCNINDFFTSILLLFGFIFSFFIYLSNQNIVFSTQNTMWIIDRIPDFLPFKHALQNYFKKFIKKKFKIIVLLRTLDKKNYEWVLNQISAYNTIMNNKHQFSDIKTDIEFAEFNLPVQHT